MAFITLSGILLDPNGDLAVGDQIRFTHKSTTGETIESAISTITVNPAGAYTLKLQYGLVLVEYKDIKSQQFKNLGVATVNGTNPATTIPELLNALVPVSSAELIEFQSILDEALSSSSAAASASSSAAASAAASAASAASAEWADIRYSKVDNPLIHIFKKNELINTLKGALTISRGSTAKYIDQYGAVRLAAVDELRQEKEGWLIEGASTNLITYSEDFSNNAWQPLAGNTKTVVTPITNPDGSTQATGFSYISGGDILRHSLSSDTSNKTLSFWIYIRDTGGATEMSCDYGDGVAQLFNISNTPLNTFTRIEVSNLVKGNSDFIDIAAIGGLTGILDVSFWGAQFEAQPFATSYIPTTNIAMTRASDKVSVLGAGNAPLLSGSNSVSFTVSTLGVRAFSQSAFTMFADDNFNRSMKFWEGNETSLLNYVSNTNSPISVSNQKDTLYIASTYDDSSVLKGYTQGVLSNSATIPYTDALNTATLIIFGGSANSNEFLFGHISDFRVYDFALKSSEVKYLAGEQ